MGICFQGLGLPAFPAHPPTFPPFLGLFFLFARSFQWCFDAFQGKGQIWFICIHLSRRLLVSVLSFSWNTFLWEQCGKSLVDSQVAQRDLIQDASLAVWFPAHFLKFISCNEIHAELFWHSNDVMVWTRAVNPVGKSACTHRKDQFTCSNSFHFRQMYNLCADENIRVWLML